MNRGLFLTFVREVAPLHDTLQKAMRGLLSFLLFAKALYFRSSHERERKQKTSHKNPESKQLEMTPLVRIRQRREARGRGGRDVCPL